MLKSKSFFTLKDEHSQSQSGLQTSQTNFLPENDGVLINYQEMPNLLDLGFYDPEYEASIQVKFNKINVKATYPKYYYKNTCVDSFKLINNHKYLE